MTARITHWTDPASFDDLVRSMPNAVVEVGEDSAGTYYAITAREGTCWMTRPVRAADMAALRAGGVG